MKRTIILLTLLILGSVSLAAQTTSKLYDKFGDSKDITSVYMPLKWLANTGILNKLADEVDDVDLGPILKKLTLLVVLSSEEEQGIRRLNAERSLISKDKNYSLIFQVRDDEDTIAGYIKSKDDITVEEFVLFALEDDETTIVQLFGKMTMEDVQRVAASVDR